MRCNAMASSQTLATIVARTATVGKGRVKPSVYFRPTAQPTSHSPATKRIAHAIARPYFAAIQARVTSSMRLEKPHSLSYQLETFTRRPDTFVRVESKVEEAGSWLKSTDTSGAVL